MGQRHRKHIAEDHTSIDSKARGQARRKNSRPDNLRYVIPAIHGEGFTEWSLLRSLKDYPSLMKPRPEEHGGLGYYKLLLSTYMSHHVLLHNKKSFRA
jgi:hypothetical protein